MRLNTNNEITGKIHYVLSTPFKLITKYCLSKKGDIAIVVGDFNKLHLYSLYDYCLKYCLESAHPMSRITNISISKKNKFFSLFYDDYNLEIYNLLEEKKINTNCECINLLIENKYDNNNNNDNSNSGLGKYLSVEFFKSTVSKFKVNYICFFS